jgi:hypothetical protein
MYRLSKCAARAARSSFPEDGMVRPVHGFIRLPLALLLSGAAVSTMPAFATPPQLAQCQAKQLKTTLPDWQYAGLGHQAKVIQVTNSSQACALRGVPRLRLLDVSGNLVKLPICANCADYGFPAKPIETVTLHRGESAYFLVGYTLDLPERVCGKVERVEVFPGDSSRPLSVEFNKDAAKTAPVCDFDVSAWRAGIYKSN